MTLRERSASGCLIVGPETMANVLLDRSAWVYARLVQAEQYGLNLGEVTLTETLLLDIREALPGLQVTMYTQPQEARTGADWQWEWWFHGTRWFGIRAQAKRLKEISSHAVGYDIGFRSGKAKIPQLDLLVQDATRNNMAAAYVLYNGPELDGSFDTLQWNCSSLAKRQEHFGVSYLPAMSAEELLRAGKLDVLSVGAASRPWACLFRCAAVGGCAAWPEAFGRAGPLDQVVARAFHLAQEEGGLPAYTAGDRAAHRDSMVGTLDERISPLRRTEPPPYVARLRELGPDARLDLEVAYTLPQGVGAVTIFEDERKRRKILRGNRSQT